VFDNRVLRRIYGPKRDEVTAKWRKLHIEELHNLYSSPDIIKQIKSRRMRWAGHVARIGEDRKVYKVLGEKPEGKRPLGRPRHRWEDGLRIDLKERLDGGEDWFQVAQDREQWQLVVNAMMNFQALVPGVHSSLFGGKGYSKKSGVSSVKGPTDSYICLGLLYITTIIIRKIE
jgi:hypothetical protein